MSLRTKAFEIKEAGVAERGNFTPTGAPLRLYNYWLRNTRSSRGRDIRRGYRAENFCHFWRVVAIWAPLMALFNAIGAVLESPKFWIAVGIAALIGIIFLGVTVAEVGYLLLTLIGCILFAAWGLIGIASGWSLTEPDDETRKRKDIPSRKTATIGAIVSPVFALTAFVFTKVKRNWTRKHSDVVGVVSAVFVAIGVLAMLVYTAITTPMGFLIGVLITLGIGLAVVGIIIAFSFLSDYIQGRRVIAREKAREKAEERALNPKPVEIVEPREPGKIDKFFTGLADFIILVAQIVRVKKWKICPIVEVDTSR